MFIVRTPLRAPESRIFSAAANGRVILRRPDKTVLFGSLLDGSTFEATESKYDEGYFCATNEDGTGHPEQCGIFGFYANMCTVRVQSWNGESWKYFGNVLDNDDKSDDSDVSENDDNSDDSAVSDIDDNSDESDSGSGSSSGSGSGSDSDSLRLRIRQ
ncbi:hypothetical protein BAE44_0010841 [Dichanthelium oligosanthes]|uniref:Uncharacterized protein n=1 Tax=Dichanthelium oligosanthes TaxID=888268 RepID=A0A1E5VSP7_9POAL|nr:hypothetical protein BAE44_0010841 [Dichanthelium oligosanthes]